MLINEDKSYTLTTSSGAATQSVTGVKNRRLVQILIAPTRSTTEFDFSITDKNSQVIYSITDYVGRYVDTINQPQYIYGNFTMALANATADEAFSIILILSEEVY